MPKGRGFARHVAGRDAGGSPWYRGGSVDRSGIENEIIAFRSAVSKPTSGKRDSTFPLWKTA